MSGTLELHAYGFAATFRLKEMAEVFTALGPVAVEKDRLVVGGAPRRALAFDFGAIVFIDVDEAARKEVIERALRRLPPEPNPPTSDTLLVEHREVARPEVRFDRVVVAELGPSVDLAAEVLAQSVAMDYYARDVEEMERRFDAIVARLRNQGRTERVRSLTRFIGLCIALRNDVISTLALFDKPAETWENEALDHLWSALRHMLELDDRYRVVEAKLKLFQENLVVLVDLSRQRHALFLEWTVVLLIAFEIVLTVSQLWRGAGH